MKKNNMPSINQYNLGALDGFLRGLSFMKPHKNSIDLCAGELSDPGPSGWKPFFTMLFSPQLEIFKYSESQISEQYLREEILKIISQIMLPDTFNTLALTLQTRLMEYIEEVVINANGDHLFWAAWSELHILEVVIDFSQGGSNRYFIFHLKDQSFFILTMKKT